MAVSLQMGLATLPCVFTIIYAALTERAQMGNRLRVFGEVRVGARGLEMYHPEMQLITSHTPLPKTQLTAIYPCTEGLTQPKLRGYIDPSSRAV